MFAWGKPAASAGHAPAFAFAGAAPASAAASVTCSGPSFLVLVATGAVATGIVLWIRERSEESRLEREHATMARDIDELEIELEAEEGNTALALEEGRVRGLLMHGRG